MFREMVCTEELRRRKLWRVGELGSVPNVNNPDDAASAVNLIEEAIWLDDDFADGKMLILPHRRS